MRYCRSVDHQEDTSPGQLPGLGDQGADPPWSPPSDRKERMDALPYYKWFWIDYRANRKVRRMSWQARGLYRDLLDEFWSEGIIPDDPAKLSEICECSIEEMKQFWPEIAPCWEAVEGGLINLKMDEQRTRIDQTRVTNSRNGRKGAIAKLANAERTPSERQAVAERTPSGRHIAEHEHEHEQSRAEEKTGPLPPPTPKIDLSPPPGNPTPIGNQVRDAVERVFFLYLAEFGKEASKYTLTVKRREQAEARFRERLHIHQGDHQKAEKDLIDAVDNLSKSEWNRNTGQVDWLEQIFCTREKFEIRLEPPKNDGGRQRTETAVTRTFREAQKAIDFIEQREQQRAEVALLALKEGMPMLPKPATNLPPPMTTAEKYRQQVLAERAQEAAR